MEQILVYSDLHFEKKTQEEKELFVQTVNQKIQELNQKNITPIVVLAGDIDNGDNAYSYIKDISAKVIYVAGNHEFWGHDFIDSIERLQVNAPSNTFFLNNSLHISQDHIFLGATLWTDGAKYSNEDIGVICSYVMNDNFNISHPGWYNPDNMALIEKKLPKQSREFIEKGRWNILIQIQEYEHSINFLNKFNDFYDFYTQHLEQFVDFNDPPVSLSALFLQNDVQEYFENKEIIVENLNSYINSSYCNMFFSQFIYNPHLRNKKIVLVTHHSAFLEEILVCYNEQTEQDNSVNFPKKRSIVSDIDISALFVSKGFNYPKQNFSTTVAGVPQKLLRTMQYFANSDKVLQASFIDKVSLMLHGHNHYFNYTDFLKSAKIATNPCGIYIDKPHLLHRQVSTFNKEHTKHIALLWSLILFDKVSYEKNLLQAKTILKNLSQELVGAINCGDQSFNLNIQTQVLALEQIYHKLDKLETGLYKAIDLRTKSSFSKENFYFDQNLINEHINLSPKEPKYKDKNLTDLLSVVNNYEALLKTIMYCGVNILYKQKKLSTIKQISSKNYLSPEEITVKDIEQMEKIYDLSFDFDCQEIEKEIEKKIQSLTQKMTTLSKIKNI